MPKIAKPLTALEVRRLGEGNHPVGDPPGLMLAVRGESRVWILRAMVAGKRRSIGVGPHHTYTLTQARERAKMLRQQIDLGQDPVAEKRALRAQKAVAKAAAVTFEQAAGDYVRTNRAAWKNDKHASQWTATLENYAFPVLGNLSVADVTTAHVLQVLKPIWSSKSETASRLRQRIERVIGAADAAAGRERLNPARPEVIATVLPTISKVRTVQHHKALPWTQAPAFMARLRQQPGQGARALEFAILTAARSGEVRGATWAEVDLDARVWVVPATRMKASKEHRVALADAAVALLEAQKPGKPAELVFPGMKGKPLSDMTLTAAIRRMQVDVTTHGFRSCFRDWAGEATHHPREVIEHALAHQIPDKAEAAYARGTLFEKRVALMRDWSAFLGH